MKTSWLTCLVMMACNSGSPDGSAPTDATSSTPHTGSSETGTVDTTGHTGTTGTTTVIQQYGDPITDAAITVSAYVENAFVVRWSGPAGQAWVEYGETATDLKRPSAPAPDGPAQRSLIGLKAGHSYLWRVVVVEPDGTGHVSEPQALTAASAPADMAFTKGAQDPARSVVASDHGFVVSSWRSLLGSWAVIVDSDADPVWWVPVDAVDNWVYAVSVTADGQAVLYAENSDDRRHEERGVIHRLAFDGTSRIDTVAPQLHHDVLELADGRYAYLAHDYLTGDLPPLGVVPYVTEQIRVVADGNTDPTSAEVVFDMEVDYPHDPWRACPDVDQPNFVPFYHEWLHGNSIIADGAGDGYWFMSRWTDMAVRLGPDWSYQGQLGGRDATWTLVGTAFAHAHASTAWDDRLLIFDNGNPHVTPLPPTRVRLYQIDAVNQVATEIWSAEDPQNGGQTTFNGDAIHLAQDHVLVEWGSENRVDELDDTGASVWRMASAGAIGRITYLADLP